MQFFFFFEKKTFWFRKGGTNPEAEGAGQPVTCCKINLLKLVDHIGGNNKPDN